MSLSSYFFLWSVLISLVGGVLSWRIWVYFQGQLYGNAGQPETVHRRVLFTQGVMLLFGLGLLVSLGGFFLSGADPPLDAMPQENPTQLTEITPSVNSPAEVSFTPTTAPVAALVSEPGLATQEPAPTLEAAFALVANSNGLGVNVRTEPGLQGPILTALPDGSEVKLLAGSESVDGFVWQEIELPDGRQGWMANNFLLPLVR